MRALIEKAASGDMAAITALTDRLDGMVPQAIEIEQPRLLEIAAPTAEEHEE